MTQQNAPTLDQIDVLCVGHASYDLIFSIPHHPEPDEKLFAQDFSAFGGGPAANAAVLVARLGLKSAFAGYLGRDFYGDKHLLELEAEGVQTRWIVRGPAPTPVSTILVKPDGRRTLVNFKGETRPLASDALSFDGASPRSILFDGHEPAVSVALAHRARKEGIATVLDAGSVHTGTQALMGLVDYLVCSEKFAAQLIGRDDPVQALKRLAEIAPTVVITLGERGLIWHRQGASGALEAYPIHAIDTTGAGDAFHGAFAAALSAGLGWRETLLTASAAGALCCTQTGARPGIPSAAQVAQFLERQPAPAEMAGR